MKKERLDIHLVKTGFFPTRQKAQSAILAGEVLVDEKIVDKPGILVGNCVHIKIKEKPHYVSRGGYKLEKVILSLNLNLKDKIVLDVGASTGGFTDCLLKFGARKVYAVDVGQGQLNYKLRQDKRVVVLEKTNIRYITSDKIPDKVDFITIDVSFISLKKVIPPVLPFLKKGGKIIALIKPQFEAGKAKVRKGVVRNQQVHKEVLEDILNFMKSLSLPIIGLIESPLLGPKGNREFFVVVEGSPSGTCLSANNP